MRSSGSACSAVEDQRVLLGVDVVGDDGERIALAHRLAQHFGERRLARADRPADADAQGAVGRSGSCAEHPRILGFVFHRGDVGADGGTAEIVERGGAARAAVAAMTGMRSRSTSRPWVWPSGTSRTATETRVEANPGGRRGGRGALDAGGAADSSGGDGIGDLAVCPLPLRERAQGVRACRSVQAVVAQSDAAALASAFNAALARRLPSPPRGEGFQCKSHCRRRRTHGPSSSFRDSARAIRASASANSFSASASLIPAAREEHRVVPAAAAREQIVDPLPQRRRVGHLAGRRSPIRAHGE